MALALATGLALLTGLTGVKTAEAGSVGACIRDAGGFGQGNVCTANDVSLSVLAVAGGGTVGCVPNQPVTDELEAQVQSGASQRYDIGLWIDTQGGDALSSGNSCYRDYLHPVSTDNSNLNLTSASGPFYNGEIGTGDACGDVQQDSVSYYRFTAEIKCVDTDNDGIADTRTAVSWDNNTGGTICLNETNTVPDLSSKCNAGRTDITGLVIAYSGWSPGQLEGEMKAGGWFTVPADPAIVFDDKYDTKWKRATALRRVNI